MGQIREIFKIFVMKQGEKEADEVESDFNVNDAKSMKSFLSRRESITQGPQVITVLDMARFVKYFAVTEDDEEYFENVIGTLADEASDEYYMKNGILFEELIQWLKDAQFFIGCELTTKEPVSVMAA